MKTTLSQITLFALAICTAGSTAALAEPGAGLTSDQKAQLQKAHDQAEANDPSLKTEEEAIKTKRTALKAQGAQASADDKTALRTEMTEFIKKLHDAELQIDPTLAPVIAKLEAMKEKAKGGGGGA